MPVADHDVGEPRLVALPEGVEHLRHRFGVGDVALDSQTELEAQPSDSHSIFANAATCRATSYKIRV